jgi:glycosyltransferase involved in cell wall biosynthesis
MISKAPVSVIVPCYCCADTVERAFASIMAQTLLPMEVIFIDDCSKDGGKTLNKLYSLKDRNTGLLDIVILSMMANDGPGSSRNLGWGITTQPYIAFLDADDSWHPKKIAIQYEWMQARPDVLLSGHLSVQLKDGDSFPLLGAITATKLSTQKLLVSNLLPTRSVMLRRVVQERFYPGKRQAEDYLLWLHIAFTGAPIYRINLPLAFSYKEDFGASGLNGNLGDSIAGVLDAYRKLVEAGHLSFWQCQFYGALAYLKHLRRKFLVLLRN